MLGWWNGRHWRLKISWGQPRAGSTPVPSIFHNQSLTVNFRYAIKCVTPFITQKLRAPPKQTSIIQSRSDAPFQSGCCIRDVTIRICEFRNFSLQVRINCVILRMHPQKYSIYQRDKSDNTGECISLVAAYLAVCYCCTLNFGAIWELFEK